MPLKSVLKLQNDFQTSSIQCLVNRNHRRI